MAQRRLMGCCAGYGPQPGFPRMLMLGALAIGIALVAGGLQVAGVPTTSAYLVLVYGLLGALLVLSSVMLVEAVRWTMR